MSNEIILASLIPVVEAFEQLGIEYYVGGAVASLTHGVYRTTADVDIIADMRVKDIEPFVLYLQDSFYLDADSIKDAITQLRVRYASLPNDVQGGYIHSKESTI